METLLLTVGIGGEPYRFLLRDVNKDGSPDRVTCSKMLSGVYTTDLDGDGRFDYYNDVEAGKVKIFAEGSLIEVESVEGLGREGVSSSELPQAISVKDGTTYVFSDGMWTRHEHK